MYLQSNRHGDKKPTVEDLEKARIELQKAKQKEEEQMRLIEQLQRQKKDLEKTQHLMQQAATSPAQG